MKNTADIFNPALAAYADLLLKNGFDIIYNASDRKLDHLHFHKNGQIGYVQNPKHDFHYFSFSTVHKPCARCGTGFQIFSEVTEPSVAMAERSFVIAPHWAQNDLPHVKKYASLEEYMEAEKKWKLNKSILSPEPVHA